MEEGWVTHVLRQVVRFNSLSLYIGMFPKIFCNAATFLRKEEVEVETLRCPVPTAPPWARSIKKCLKAPERLQARGELSWDLRRLSRTQYLGRRRQAATPGLWW